METEKKLQKQRKFDEQIEEFKKWRDVAPALNWRAWGSWFSWGSPVGLGLFFVLLGVTFAIVKFAITL